jgi:peptidoglycan/xylan/chitin deacetylase (PgdA/CDA1 family)
MFINRRFLLVIGLMGLGLLLVGCSGVSSAYYPTLDPAHTVNSIDVATNTATPFMALTNTPGTIPPTDTPTFTNTPPPTKTSIPTDTPPPTFTSDLVWHAPGEVTAPILLYHHVASTSGQNRYFVSVANFRSQMEALREWGYTSITVSDLVNVLINGGELPSRPVLITFDDGYLDVYQNAFPILHKMGFVATTYIVVDRLQSPSCINAAQLREMANDGWEIGCHSMTHADLTADHSIVDYEIIQSRRDLEEAIGVPINTFAYPYGKIDEFVVNKVIQNGYTAGIGWGMNQNHTLISLLYLNRREVEGDYGLSEFVSLLPWSN